MKSKFILVIFTFLLLSSCNKSLVSKCPTGNYEDQKFHKQKLTLEQKSQLRLDHNDSKIVLRSLYPRETHSKPEPAEYASSRPILESNLRINNYKPFEGNSSLRMGFQSAPKASLHESFNSVKKEEVEFSETVNQQVKNSKLNIKDTDPEHLAEASYILGIIGVVMAVIGASAPIFAVVPVLIISHIAAILGTQAILKSKKEDKYRKKAFIGAFLGYTLAVLSFVFLFLLLKNFNALVGAP